MSELKENEPGIVWCKPWGEGQGDYVRVNVSDFDPAVHELLDTPAGAAGELTAAQLKEKLTELGVEFKGNASKAVLQGLYDVALSGESEEESDEDDSEDEQDDEEESPE